MTRKSPHFFGTAIVDGVERFVRRWTRTSALEVIPEEELAEQHAERQRELEAEERAARSATPFWPPTVVPTAKMAATRPPATTPGALSAAEAKAKWAAIRGQIMEKLAAEKAGLVQRVCKKCDRSFESTVDRLCNACVGRSK
ncbi:MAG: hypothetical protein ACRD88_17690 [Terriglobia bacterium]